MADGGRDSLDAQPAVQCKTANKQLAIKHTRAAERWLRIQNALEKEKKDFDKKINVDRSVLLKQRERLQTTTTLNTAPETSSQIREAVTARRMTLADVYDALIKAVKEEQKPYPSDDHRSVQSEPHRRRSSTLSFENKRVTRKPVYFSLQNLQRAQTSLHSRLQTIAQEQEHRSVEENDGINDEATASQMGPFDLSEEEKALGPKLRLPPTGLPPIRNQTLFQPRARSFEKRRLRSCPDSCDVDEVKYCRYVRLGRRNSAPTPVRPGMNLKYSSMNKLP